MTKAKVEEVGELLEKAKAEELLDELIRKGEALLASHHWKKVKTVQTSVGTTILVNCSPLGKVDLRKHPGDPTIAGAKGVLNVDIQTFLDAAVKGMATNCPKWDETLVKINTVQQISENLAVYQYVPTLFLKVTFTRFMTLDVFSSCCQSVTWFIST